MPEFYLDQVIHTFHQTPFTFYNIARSPAQNSIIFCVCLQSWAFYFLQLIFNVCVHNQGFGSSHFREHFNHDSREQKMADHGVTKITLPLHHPLYLHFSTLRNVNTVKPLLSGPPIKRTSSIQWTLSRSRNECLIFPFIMNHYSASLHGRRLEGKEKGIRVRDRV